MKKLIIPGLVIAALVTLSACATNGTKQPSDSTTTTSQQTTQPGPTTTTTTDTQTH
jgi:ABC-type glycerol-3-phosphate transport system substrate-binding protein